MPQRRRRAPHWIAFVAALPALAAAEAPPLAPEVDREIRHLLAYVEGSGCAFVRNGTAYAAAEGRRHIEKKLAYLAERDRIASTEDFIALAASKSSLSGRRYRVRCPGEAEQASGDWLRAELTRLRAAPAAGTPRGD